MGANTGMGTPREIFRNRGGSLLDNILALYSVQAVTYLAPLITIPYLGRVLGAAGFGTVAFFQAIATSIALVVEFGFGYSATREIAIHSQDAHFRGRLLASVATAKLLLLAAASIFMLPLYAVVSRVTSFREPDYYVAALVQACGLSLNFIWYFQGLNRLRFVAILDVGAKMLAIVFILGAVHNPTEGPRVLLSWGVCSFLATSVSIIVAYREVPFTPPTGCMVVRALREGLFLFLFRASTTMYGAGNALLVGVFCTPAQVGYYSAAERIVRSLVGLLAPISNTMYPRISGAMAEGRQEAARLCSQSMVLMGGVGLLLSGGTIFAAPAIIRIAFGQAFGPAVPVLQILAVLPLLTAFTNVLGIQWMVPLKMDRTFTAIIAGAGLFNVGLAASLLSRFKHFGMGFCVSSTELMIFIAMFLVLRHRHLLPHVLARTGQHVRLNEPLYSNLPDGPPISSRTCPSEATE